MARRQLLRHSSEHQLVAPARRLRVRRRPVLRDSFRSESRRYFKLSSEPIPLLPAACGCSGGTEVLGCCAPTSGPRDGIVRVLASDVTRRKFLGACCATGFGIVASGPLAAILAACGSESAATSATTLRVGHLPAGCIQHLLLASINGLFKKAGRSRASPSWPLRQTRASRSAPCAWTRSSSLRMERCEMRVEPTRSTR